MVSHRLFHLSDPPGSGTRSSIRGFVDIYRCWITAISEDIEFAVVAGCADVGGSTGTRRGSTGIRGGAVGATWGRQRISESTNMKPCVGPMSVADSWAAPMCLVAFSIKSRIQNGSLCTSVMDWLGMLDQVFEIMRQ